MRPDFHAATVLADEQLLEGLGERDALRRRLAHVGDRADRPPHVRLELGGGAAGGCGSELVPRDEDPLHG